MITPDSPYYETEHQLLYAILQHFDNSLMPLTVPEPPYYNTTDSLLYAILNNLGNSTEPPVTYYQFRVLYVSARYGDDATAEVNNIRKPFKTIGNAILHKYFGDLIYVLPGRYNEGNIFSNGNIWFDQGAELTYTGTGAIFHQSSGECVVRGYGVFKCTGNANVANVGNWMNCVLDIECESMEAIQSTVILWQNKPDFDPSFYKPHRIRAKRCFSRDGYAVHCNYNSHTDIAIDEITSNSSLNYSFYGTNIRKCLVKNSVITSDFFQPVYIDATKTVEMRSCKVICNADIATGHGIQLQGFYGSFTILSTSIYCKNINAKSFFVVNPLVMYLDNNVTANRDTGGNAITYMGYRIALENKVATCDITGQTSIDLSAFQNVDSILLTSSNPNETIGTIVNAPTHHSFKLIPANGLQVTLNSTSPASASNNSIVLTSPSVVLNGSNGDWIELHKAVYGIGSRQVNKANY